MIDRKLAGAACLAAGVWLFASPAQAVLLHSNGGLSTGPTTDAGDVAPPGATWSELQADAGTTTPVNGALGIDITQGTYRIADDITVPAGEVWTIASIDVYGYVLSASPEQSPFVGTTMQIWKGVPGGAASVVVAGDAVTNRLTASVDTLMYRVYNT